MDNPHHGMDGGDLHVLTHEVGAVDLSTIVPSLGLFTRETVLWWRTRYTDLNSQ